MIPALHGVTKIVLILYLSQYLRQHGKALEEPRNPVRTKEPPRSGPMVAIPPQRVSLAGIEDALLAQRIVLTSAFRSVDRDGAVFARFVFRPASRDAPLAPTLYQAEIGHILHALTREQTWHARIAVSGTAQDQTVRIRCKNPR